MIFVSSQRDTIEFSRQLKAKGVKVAAYSSTETNRANIEQQFLDGKIRVIVSTIALGMGFDKRDIHTVINAYTPASPVSFYQEIGRAGRDSSISATAYLLCRPPFANLVDDVPATWRKFVDMMQNKKITNIGVKDANIWANDSNVSDQLFAKMKDFAKKKKLLERADDPISLSEANSTFEDLEEWKKDAKVELLFMKVTLLIF